MTPIVDVECLASLAGYMHLHAGPALGGPAKSETMSDDEVTRLPTFHSGRNAEA